MTITAVRPSASRTYIAYKLHPYGWRAHVRRVAVLSARECRASRERARRALHEAAHAVVARAIGLDVEFLSIDEQGENEGVCRIIWPTERYVPIKSLFFQLAGIAAEVFEHGCYDDGCSQDLARAHESAREFIGDRRVDPEGLAARCVLYFVTPLVAEHWYDIQETALALLRARYPLEGPEEMAVLGPIPTHDCQHVIDARQVLHATADGPAHRFWHGGPQLQNFLERVAAADEVWPPGPHEADALGS